MTRLTAQPPAGQADIEQSVYVFSALSTSALGGALSVLLACGWVAAHAQADDLAEARALIREGQSGRALEQINAYLETNADDAGARFLRGVALTESGRHREAVEVFTTLTRDFPELPEPYNNLAVLHARNGDLEAARSALLEAIRIHPRYATAHENLGDVYAKMAAAEFGRASELDPSNTTAREKLRVVDALAAGTPSGVEPVGAGHGSATASEEKVLAMVAGWADAWSKQDVDAYLAHYGAEYLPAGGLTRAEWAKIRRERLRSPEFISIGIDSPEVHFENASRAVVRFTQSYRSDTYRDQVTKRLDLVKEGGRWKIRRETTIN